jgi:hypothetical protein
LVDRKTVKDQLNIDILYHLSYAGQCLPAKINIAIFIHVLLLLAIALSVRAFDNYFWRLIVSVAQKATKCVSDPANKSGVHTV